MCVLICACARCVCLVFRLRFGAFSPPPTSVTEALRETESGRGTVGRRAARWALGAVVCLFGPAARTCWGEWRDRDWGVVKGVVHVEEWGRGVVRRSLVLENRETASTCARLSKGRVSRVSPGYARAGRAALSFFWASPLALSGRVRLYLGTCPACPVCSLTLLSPHSSLHLCPLSAFSPTLPVPRPAHHPAMHTRSRLSHTPRTARDTHMCVNVCSASPKLSWQLLFEKIGNMTVHVASPLPATHSRARSGTGTEVHPLSGGRARLRLARSPLQEGAQPSVQARWRGWLCDRGLI